MKTRSQCQCPGCQRMFNAVESSYSATRMDHGSQGLQITDTPLCKRCSDHATQKTHRGKMIIKRLLAHAVAGAPADVHVVH